jgi:hypothetical protein
LHFPSPHFRSACCTCTNYNFLYIYTQLQTPQKKSDRQVSWKHGLYIVENPLTPTRAKGIFLSEWKRKSNQSDGRQNIQPPPPPTSSSQHPDFSYTQPSSFRFHYGSPYKPQQFNCIKTGRTLRTDEGEHGASSLQDMNTTQRTLSADASQRQFVLPVSWCCFEERTVQIEGSFYRTFMFR